MGVEHHRALPVRPRYAPGQLYPEALPARFVAEQWMDWQQTTLNPAGRDAFMQWIRTPATQRNDALIQRSVAPPKRCWRCWTRTWRTSPSWQASTSPWPTFPLGCEIHRWWGLPERTARPHLERWFQALRERPGARGVLDQPLS